MTADFVCEAPPPSQQKSAGLVTTAQGKSNEQKLPAPSGPVKQYGQSNDLLERVNLLRNVALRQRQEATVPRLDERGFKTPAPILKSLLKEIGRLRQINRGLERHS